MRVAGTIAVETATSVIAAGRKRVAARIGCDESDIAFSDGYFRHVGSNVSFSLFETAALAPLDDEAPFPGLSAEHDYRSPGLTFPNGCHICEVEIDPQTGAVTTCSYVAVDDVGRVINPMIVEGQLHGGLAQGLGQAIMEHCLFDEESGQLLSGSFIDYAMPRASDMPPIVSETYNAVAINNPIGVKGAGEAGTTAAPPAVVNAVVDALSEFGIDHVDMPVTPERIWALIASHKRPSETSK
jgi:carbon-monoxide dehydrogenase large subunit